jgi:ABC-2 type transport system ATP-binding protein
LIITLVGLQEKRRANVVTLSGGQRQRLALGIALLNDPEILLLDEPTTGLDPNARREVWNILLQLKARKRTSIILTTHYMEEAEQLCDHIIIMDQGKILTEGSPEQLLSQSQEEKVIEFTLDRAGTFDDSLLTQQYNISWDQASGNGSLRFKQYEKELPEFFAFVDRCGLKIKHFECRRKTLDDLFISLTGKHLHE